jgi:hypothetical protein
MAAVGQGNYTLCNSIKTHRCWYRIGSPPTAGSKNDMFRLRSVSSIVIASARTGSDSNNN